MSAPLSNKITEWFAPLAYGKEGDIAPDQLLRRGQKATMFATRAEASAAIRDTIAKAKADGDKWPEKYDIYLLTVEDSPSNASYLPEISRSHGMNAVEDVQYKSLFEQAVRALAAIDDALGIGDDGCGDLEQTLTAIADLKASPISEEAMDILHAEINRLRKGLSAIESEPINAEYMARNILDGLPPYHDTMLDCEKNCPCKSGQG
mgnify:CR=1 FL=1